MRALKFPALAALLATASSLFAGEAGRRILTVEYWSGRTAQVWAVDGNLVRQYEIHDSGAPSRIRAQHEIEAIKLDVLRRTVAAIPDGLRGHVYFAQQQDGLMMRISFSSDGSLRNDRVELQNVWLPDFAPLVDALNAILPPKTRVTFPQDVEEQARAYPRGRDHESKTIRDYYGS